eukprot:4938951-Prymnesium_polylepis.1
MRQPLRRALFSSCYRLTMRQPLRRALSSSCYPALPTRLTRIAPRPSLVPDAGLVQEHPALPQDGRRERRALPDGQGARQHVQRRLRQALLRAAGVCVRADRLRQLVGLLLGVGLLGERAAFETGAASW